MRLRSIYLPCPVTGKMIDGDDVMKAYAVSAGSDDASEFDPGSDD